MSCSQGGAPARLQNMWKSWRCGISYGMCTITIAQVSSSGAPGKTDTDKVCIVWVQGVPWSCKVLLHVQCTLQLGHSRKSPGKRTWSNTGRNTPCEPKPINFCSLNLSSFLGHFLKIIEKKIQTVGCIDFSVGIYKISTRHWSVKCW